MAPRATPRTQGLLTAARSGLTTSPPQTALRDPGTGVQGLPHQRGAERAPCASFGSEVMGPTSPAPRDAMGQGRPDRGTQGPSPAVAAEPWRAAGANGPRNWLGGGRKGLPVPDSARPGRTPGEAAAAIPAPERRAASGPEAANWGPCSRTYRLPRAKPYCPGSGMSVRTTEQAAGLCPRPRPQSCRDSAPTHGPAPSLAETPPRVPPTPAKPEGRPPP